MTTEIVPGDLVVPDEYAAIVIHDYGVIDIKGFTDETVLDLTTPPSLVIATENHKMIGEGYVAVLIYDGRVGCVALDTIKRL